MFDKFDKFDTFNVFNRINKDRFDEIYKIMEESFPDSEFRVRSQQRDLFDVDIYSVYGIENNENLKGFLAVWDMGEFVYIEHFAVSRDFRNKGLGGKFLAEFLNNFSNETGDMKGRLVILEVELPENELATKRIGFYERYGFFFNDFEYTQPPLRDGYGVLPLRLMSFPTAVDALVFKGVRDTLYRVVYGRS